jgi:hypothetical protein
MKPKFYFKEERYISIERIVFGLILTLLILGFCAGVDMGAKPVIAWLAVMFFVDYVFQLNFYPNVRKQIKLKVVKK